MKTPPLTSISPARRSGLGEAAAKPGDLGPLLSLSAGHPRALHAEIEKKFASPESPPAAPEGAVTEAASVEAEPSGWRKVLRRTGEIAAFLLLPPRKP